MHKIIILNDLGTQLKNLFLCTSQTLITMINAMNIIASPLIKIDIEILNRKQYRHDNHMDN